MTTVHVMRGLPGSGKSTLARQLDAVRFNMDDIRAMMGLPQDHSRELENTVVWTMIEGAKTAVRSGQNVCLDNTHLVPRLPKIYRQEFGQFPDVEFVVHDLTDVTIEECVIRDAGRESPVGERVIRSMAKRMTGWNLTPEWLTPTRGEVPESYVPNWALPSVVCADLDGTLALHDESERGHYEYEKVLYDRPNDEVIALVKTLHDSQEYGVIFMSGREDRCRSDTVQWLEKYLGFSGPLFMRKTGDHRPDYLVKTELFNEHVRNAYCVRFVLDDRNQVVDRWRQLGLDCYQVRAGNF